MGFSLGSVPGLGAAGAAIDPSGFHISVGVVYPNGQRVSLWMSDGGGFSISNAASQFKGAVNAATGGLLGGESSGPPDDLVGADLPIVESVEVEMTYGLVATVTIQIAAPYDLGLKLLESGLFAVGHVYEVQIGYTRIGRFTPVFRAIASKPSIKISGDEGLTVTLNGSGGGLAANRTSSARVFENKSYRDIIKEVAGRYGWGLKFGNIDEGGGLAGDVVGAVTGALGSAAGIGGGQKKSPLDEIRVSTSQGNDSDWHFIQSLVRQVGCDAWLSPERDSDDGKPTLHIQMRDEGLNSKPKYRFLLRGNPDFIESFPILDLESEAEFVWLPAAAVRVTSRDIDPDTGKVKETEATQESSRDPVLGDAGVPSSAQKNVDGVKVQIVDADPDPKPSGLGGLAGAAAGAVGIGGGGSQGDGGKDRTGQYLPVSSRDPRKAGQLAQAQRDEGSMRGGINVNITSYAIPEMMPVDVVRVDGAGPFNTNYGVMKVKHTANGTEWTMRLELLNNSAAQAFWDETWTKEAEKKNTKETDQALGDAISGATGIVDAVKDAML